ncbi:MAG: dihydroorotase family protein [Armatimonadetes bacterium]|nr:dihydroorotase family protein [Armatimonadota bacterium]
MNRLLVEGRLVDGLEGVRTGQVLMESGIIQRVGDRLGRPDLRFDDAHLVFPGFGDIHVHLREGQEHKEDFTTGSRAALHGGVTFMLDMPNNPEPPVDAPSLERKAGRVGDPPAAIRLYAAMGPGTRPFGHSHYKAFMAHSIGPLYFESLAQVEEAVGRYRGCRITFHCEDPEMLERAAGAARHEDRRPPEAEIAAIEAAVAMAARHELRANIAHLSTAGGLEVIRRARAQGLEITCEVTPHHLYFDRENRAGAERADFLKMNPPLRSPSDREALLEAVLAGEIDFLATDHAPHTVEEKASENPSGVPHLDTYGGFVAWLLHRGWTPEAAARHASLRPGQFFGERVGRLAPGYRGDLAVLRLDREWTVRAEDLQTRCGWSPFEGERLPGRVAVAVARGRVFRGGEEVT